MERGLQLQALVSLGLSTQSVLFASLGRLSAIISNHCRVTGAVMAVEGQRRPRLSPKALSSFSIAPFSFSTAPFFFSAAVAALSAFALLAPLPAATKSAPTRSRVAYSEPTPAEGGQVVHYNFTLGVAKKAPDCYRES